MNRKILVITVVAVAISVAASLVTLNVAPDHTKHVEPPIQPPVNSTNLLPPAPEDTHDILKEDRTLVLNDTDTIEYAGPEIPSKMAMANNAFAINLYKQIKADSKHEDANIFFSPFGLYTAASLLYEGARGDTASQIRDVFGFEPDDDARHKLMSNASSSINRNDPDATLVTANALWLDKQFVPHTTYVDIARDTYNADVDSLDFYNEPKNSAQRINDWASEKTKGKITEIISEKTIKHLSAILNNAIYFKGTWASQFDPAETHKREFWITPGNSVTADFMRVTSTFDRTYYPNPLTSGTMLDDVLVLRMPYVGDRLSMLIFLPSERDGIHDLEDAISARDISMLQTHMYAEEVTVILPKFETKTSYELDDSLSNLGMVDAFDRGAANFSGMVDLAKLPGNLYVERASQSAFVKVNEEGTEAAAVTTFEMRVISEPLQFIADHPFVFAIQDDESGAILFMGRLSNPTM